MALKAGGASRSVGATQRSRNAVVALKEGVRWFTGSTWGGSRNAVVALKFAKLFNFLRHEFRSRNAVVALKYIGGVPICRYRNRKQERRGGIEMPLPPRRCDSPARSRNAVVALK